MSVIFVIKWPFRPRYRSDYLDGICKEFVSFTFTALKEISTVISEPRGENLIAFENRWKKMLW